MKFSRTVLLLIFSSAGPFSAANAGEVPLFQPIPDWVVSAGKIVSGDAATGGIILLDRQQKVENDRVWSYSDVAVRAVSTEQLNGLGNLALSWHPDKGDLIINRIEIIRGDQIIDVTKSGSKFTVLRREQNLEQQAISGILTATMQVEGLKVGDVIRLAATISFSDSALGGNVELGQPLVAEPIKVGKSALRIIWPQSVPLKWRVTKPEIVPVLSKRGIYNELIIAQPSPKPAELPTDAPLRFAPPSFVEATTFANWADVAKAMVPLYATDGSIAVGSPLAERVAKIATASADPKIRTAMALRLVQDDIRYLFNGQAQGNYLPQRPIETWDKRYGDCKAKSLLLVAILRQLGIQAEAALVSSQMGDLLTSRLPSMLAFDHVITRATIGGETFWLDGTALGTRLPDLADPPAFRFALPITALTTALVPIAFKAPARPLLSIDTDIDATAGIALPKPYKIKLTFRGQKVFQIRQAQATLEGKGLNDAIDQLVQPYLNDPTVIKRSLRFDDIDGSVRIEAEGLTNLAWQREDDRRAMALSNIFTDFEISGDRNRLAWQAIAVSTGSADNFESHYRIRLPNAGKGFQLENPKDISGRFSGYDMRSRTKLEDGVFELDDAWKTSLLEISSSALASEREKLARAKAGPIKIVAPEDYPPAWREQRAARAAGLTKRVEAAYAAEIADDPKEVTGYINLARFLTGIDDKSGAISELNKIIELRPDAASYLWRAGLYNLSDPKKAIEDIKAAQAIEPGSPVAIIALAKVLVQQRRFDEAVAAIDAGLPLQKVKADLLAEKAETLARAGRGQESLEIINKANLDKPGNPGLLNSACWVRAIINAELERALKDCTKAIELSEEPANMLDSRGLVYTRMKRYDDAIADLDAVLRLNPAIAESLFVRGVAKSFKGATAEAKSDIHDALILDPSVEKRYAEIGVKPG